MNTLEKQVENCFNKISSVLPCEISADDFQLKEVLAWFGDIKGKKLLDAGCAKGRFTKALVERGAFLTGIDITENFIKIARENVAEASFGLASITDIPFQTNTFDGILCIQVMEHIPDTEKAIREMARVLKRGGRLIIIDKNILSLHHRYLAPTSLLKRIQETRGKWMYPEDFPFREKHFTLGKLDRILGKYCSVARSKYLQNGRSRRSRIIYNILPFLSYDIAWRGIK